MVHADFEQRSPSGSPRLNGNNPEQYELQKSVSKAQSIRELRAAQELVLERINNPKCSDKSLFEGAQTYIKLREQLRIEKGIIKPGSRNVSVRELSAAEQVKRLPRSSNRPTDYLADAKATLAQAEAVAARQMPDSAPIPPKE